MSNGTERKEDDERDILQWKRFDKVSWLGDHPNYFAQKQRALEVFSGCVPQSGSCWQVLARGKHQSDRCLITHLFSITIHSPFFWNLDFCQRVAFCPQPQHLPLVEPSPRVFPQNLKSGELDKSHRSHKPGWNLMWLCHMGPKHLTSLSLNFDICKMGLIYPY